ncbi:MAG: prepilin-type N-terminal cleavage/methylation domain-containing protein [Kiritimatiellae bacterium]|nr:prepilin-type N-terminal cleavage/methylation domain-containing protein [Kiritimatiellia bacterium]
MKRSAFTLIEVLASMAVLMVLTLALTRMFISASDITSRGMTSIARNSVGETAMESILQDLDCMVVNERVACCKIADTVEGRFDTIYFIGTYGDNDDDMPYEYFNYFVSTNIVTNALGAVYKRFDLVKSRVVMAVGAKNRFYALLPDDKEWWNLFDKELSMGEQDHEVLAENVVGFEVYCQDWATGQDLNSPGTIRWNGGNRTFFSSAKSMSIKDKTGHSIVVSNLPPVAFDVKLKITSPEAAMEGGMLLAAGGADNEKRGWELINREASTLFGRAMPMMGATQFRLQRRSYNPVSHYYSEED